MISLQGTPIRAFEYKEQALEPVAIEAETDQQNRVLAPKIKTYPFLNQLESLLYPSKNFKSENPSQRLERLEMAVFGTKQNGSISTRLNNLKTELENWQIGNMKTMKPLELKAQGSMLNDKREKYPYQQYNNPAISNHSALSIQHSAHRDYDYMNYRLATPLIQNIGRRTIDAFFK